MRKYKLYISNRDERAVITQNDCVVYRKDSTTTPWIKVSPLCTFMAGDIALDNGFEFQKDMTEIEIFAEML